MLSALLTWSMTHRLAVLLAWAVIAGLGVFALSRLPLDAFPDTTPIQVQVNTTAEGLSPVDVEQRITARVEAAIGGLDGLVSVRSLSKYGLSQVTATFDDGTPITQARQAISERLAGVELEPGLGPPTLGPVASGLGEVFHYLVTGTRSLAELRAIQDYLIRPRLLSVPGVAEVNSWGGEVARLEIRVDPRRLAEREIELADLIDTLRDNLGNRAGGPMDVGGEGALVQGLGLPRDDDELGAMVIGSREGLPVRLSDVAEIARGHELRLGAVSAQGGGEVVLGLGFARLGENGREVTRLLETRLDELARDLPDGVRATPVYERTWLVDQVLDTVAHSLTLGAALVIAVLFVFLGNLRAGLVVALVIPLSLLMAGNLMLVFGVAGSLMSLGALDFGLLVDSAVIQVENVVAKASPDATNENPEDRLASTRAAILEVRKPTIFGELIIAVVFLPILLLEGIEGKMFAPMALTMLFALLGSLLLSLTLVPALSTFVRPAPHRGPTFLARAYRKVVRVAIRRPLVVLAVSLPLVVFGGLLATRLGTEFVPRLSEGSIVVNTIRLAGVSLEESVRHGTHLERFLLERYPEVIDRIWTRTGTAEVTTDPMGVELSDVFIMLKPRERWHHRFENQDILLADMRELVSGLPGMRAVFTQPIEMRLAEMGAGIRSDLGVVLHGDDYEVLRERAAAIQRVLEAIPGASDVVTEPLTGQPLLEVHLDHEALGRLGLMPRSVLGLVEALAGARVGVLIEGERRVPIDVVLDPAQRLSPEHFEAVWVTGPGGVRVPLSRVASLHRVEVPSNIQRESSRRRVVVQANVRERDLGSFVAEARQLLHRQVVLPDGYYLSFSGRFEHLERAHERLYMVIPLALVLVLALLAFTYRRALDVVRVFIGVPFAALGGVLALHLRDMPLSVSAAVGFVALIGVSVLGDMVLVSTIRRRSRTSGLGEPLLLAVENAATERLRPVVMTALVAGLGFLPMALSNGFGAEVQRPLATVVVGGLTTSVLATLLVLPALYTLASRR